MVGRFLMYTTLLVLAVFVGSSYLILEHGGGTIAQVKKVTIHDLTSSSAAYDDAPVTTDGTLQFNAELDRWEIIDTDANFGVEIRLHEDESLLQSLEGRRVTVHGVFGADGESGVYINADTVHAAGE